MKLVSKELYTIHMQRKALRIYLINDKHDGLFIAFSTKSNFCIGWRKSRWMRSIVIKRKSQCKYTYAHT